MKKDYYIGIADKFANVVFQVGFSDSYLFYIKKDNGKYDYLHLAIEGEKNVLYVLGNNIPEENVGIKIAQHNCIDLISSVEFEEVGKKLEIADDNDNYGFFKMEQLECNRVGLEEMIEKIIHRNN